MDVNTEAVLYSKNADTQLYPASITKILTTLLACENLNAKTNITVSEKASTSVTAGDSSIYAAPGEKFTRDQALWLSCSSPLMKSLSPLRKKFPAL